MHKNLLIFFCFSAQIISVENFKSLKITDNKLHFKTKLDSFDNYAYAAQAIPLQTKSQFSRRKAHEFKKNGIGQKDIILGDETPLKKRVEVEWQSNKSRKNGQINYFIWAGTNVILKFTL